MGGGGGGGEAAAVGALRAEGLAQEGRRGAQGRHKSAGAVSSDTSLPRATMRLLLTLALLAGAAQATAPPFAPGALLTVTSASLNAQTQQGPLLLAVVADFCTHCQRLKPALFEAAAALRSEVAVATLDGVAERALAARLGVRGFPTVLLMRSGKLYEYPAQGSRTAAALVAWARTGYVAVEPAPFWRTPNNALGRLAGKALALPGLAAALRERLASEHGVGDGTLVVALLAALLAGGVAAVALLDAVVGWTAPRPHAA